MGSYKVEENGEYSRGSQKVTRSHLMIFFLSMLISTAGASVLGWWLHKYHPANRQLWMVPFGLILFLTPLTVWFSLIMSDLLCISKKEDDEVLGINRRVHPIPMNDSLCSSKI